MNLVTVIVINYNGASYIKRCLMSLAQQTFSSFRAIIVDNGSTDDSRRHFEGLDSRFQVILLDQNRGFAAANNLAIKLAETKWVATLNPDAFPNPDWLEKLMQGTLRYPQISFFGSVQLQDRDENRFDGIGDVYSFLGLFWRGAFDYPVYRLDSDGEIFSPCAAAALYKLSALNEVNGFDESFFCYCEDIDLGFRLRLKGHKCVLIKDAIVNHLGSESVGRYGDFAIYHGFRNRLWTFVKNYPGPIFLAIAPLTFITVTLLAVDKMRIGKSRPAMTGIIDAIKDIKRVWKERKHVQSSTNVTCFQIYQSMCWSPVKLIRRSPDIRSYNNT